MAENLISENRTIRDQIRRRIITSGKSVVDRVRNEGLRIDYARDEDHLYVMLGVPTLTLSIPLEDELDGMVLYDPDTCEIRGFEILFFMEKMERYKPKAKFWQLVVDFIHEHGDNVYIPANLEREEVERAFREVAFA
jgi:hypothetical protein